MSEPRRWDGRLLLTVGAMIAAISTSFATTTLMVKANEKNDAKQELQIDEHSDKIETVEKAVIKIEVSVANIESDVEDYGQVQGVMAEKQTDLILEVQKQGLVSGQILAQLKKLNGG